MYKCTFQLHCNKLFYNNSRVKQNMPQAIKHYYGTGYLHRACATLNYHYFKYMPAPPPTHTPSLTGVSCFLLVLRGQ